MSGENDKNKGFIDQPSGISLGVDVGNSDAGMPYESVEGGVSLDLLVSQAKTYFQMGMQGNLGVTKTNSDIEAPHTRTLTHGLDLGGKIGYALHKNVSVFGGAEIGSISYGNNGDDKVTSFACAATDATIFGGVGFMTDNRKTQVEASGGRTVFKGFGVDASKGAYTYGKVGVRQVVAEKDGATVAVKASIETPIGKYHPVKPSFNVGAVVSF